MQAAHGNSRSISNPREVGAIVGAVATTLDVFSLGSAVQRLLQAGLAPATHRSYFARKKKYLLFCIQSGTTRLPVTEDGLLHVIAFVASQGLRHTTIKGYLSAIRHLQVCSGSGDPGMGACLDWLWPFAR